MADRVIEGVWEEITARGPEFAGRRVRVTVIDGAEGTMTLDRSLAPLLEEAEALVRRLPPVAGPSPSDGWGDAVVAKYGAGRE